MMIFGPGKRMRTSRCKPMSMDVRRAECIANRVAEISYGRRNRPTLWIKLSCVLSCITFPQVQLGALKTDQQPS